jgi:NADH-quinone oxidoreductase subunit J
MNALFYISGGVAVAATLMTITRKNAVHALLYMILSLLAVSLVFFSLGAPFIAALEVMVYAGAIMVLFVFAIMMLNLGPQSSRQEGAWLAPSAWIGPGVLAAVLLCEVILVLVRDGPPAAETSAVIGPEEVGAALFGPYLLAVELAAILLLAGLVGAYHLGRREEPES